MIRGLDASAVQGPLPFAPLVAQGLRFVILKAQQGNDGFDPWFGRNMRHALENGLEAFAYCFAYPLPPNSPKKGPVVAGGIPGRDPRDQARMAVDRVLAYPEMRGRPLFLDLEWPPPNEWAEWGCTSTSISDWCRVYAAEVALLYGVAPVLYTYPWWWAEVSKGTDTSWAGAYGLWMADYRAKGRWPADGERPNVPFPWVDWLFWQHDGDGGLRLPNGVDADFCVFNGTEEQLRDLRVPQPVNDWAIVHPRVDLVPPDDGPPEAA